MTGEKAKEEGEEKGSRCLLSSFRSPASLSLFPLMRADEEAEQTNQRLF